jgi:hypothetical protein
MHEHMELDSPPFKPFQFVTPPRNGYSAEEDELLLRMV